MTAEQSTDIRLIVANQNDAPALAALARIIWREAFADMITSEQIEYMLRTIQSESAMRQQMTDGMRYHFVERGGNRVGYTAVTHESSGISKLSKLYILAEQRDGSVALKVLNRLIEHAVEAGNHTLSLTVNKGNARAIRFYEKHGFTTREAIVMDIGGGFVMDDYVMDRTLNEAQRA